MLVLALLLAISSQPIVFSPKAFGAYSDGTHALETSKAFEHMSRVIRLLPHDEIKIIEMRSGEVYLLARDPAYGHGWSLDGFSHVQILGPEHGKDPVLRADGGAYSGKTFVLLSMGRTSTASDILIRGITLDTTILKSSNVDTQQSSTLRSNGTRGLQLEDVFFDGPAADAVKLTETHWVRALRVRVRGAGRSAFVFQRGTEDVEIDQLVTEEIDKGPIDSEPTGPVGARGPKRISILNSSLMSGLVNGRRADYGLSIAGIRPDIEGQMEDVLIANCDLDASIWLRNASNVRFINVRVDSGFKYGLHVDELISGVVFAGGLLKGSQVAAFLTAHGNPLAIPSGLRFVDTILEAPRAIEGRSAQAVAVVRSKLVRTGPGVPEAALFTNELAGASLTGFRFEDVVLEGFQKSARFQARDDRKTERIDGLVSIRGVIGPFSITGRTQNVGVPWVE